MPGRNPDINSHPCCRPDEVGVRDVEDDVGLYGDGPSALPVALVHVDVLTGVCPGGGSRRKRRKEEEEEKEEEEVRRTEGTINQSFQVAPPLIGELLRCEAAEHIQCLCVGETSSRIPEELNQAQLLQPLRHIASPGMY
ncbi:unnamed protein product [Pleuronectes platessa]|uniref:Uncharacterized protein n=1 Tax=Pleuronectes platessa TaxID=8262 RepID=A0A9N7Z1U0_PLEPL|nr:unnamed protein product [Pleuronectes platessa]